MDNEIKNRRWGIAIKIAARAVMLASALLLVSCFSLRTTKGPIDSLEYIDARRSNTTLVVFLPGIYDGAVDFERQGLVKAVRDRHLNIDMVAVDTHFGYYLAGNFIDRLRTDIIMPAHRRGYRDIWLVGISLGGLGSLLYSKAYPNEITGALLIAPFLGYPTLRLDPGQWLENRQGEEGMWGWLAEYRFRNKSDPPIFLAYGEEDRYVNGSVYLAQFLSSQNVICIPGDHDWPTWKTLWDKALDKGLLAFAASPQMVQANEQPFLPSK